VLLDRFWPVIDIPCGQDDLPDGGANNARAISEAARYVAAYRPAKSSATAAGTLGLWLVVVLSLGRLAKERTRRRDPASESAAVGTVATDPKR
jgi:hypothetical protein